LARANCLAFVGILDLEASGKFSQHCNDFRPLVGESLRNDEAICLDRLAERISDSPAPVDVALGLKVVVQDARLIEPEDRWPFVVADNRNLCKLVRLNDAEAYPGVPLNLPLEVFGELLVAFSGNHR